MIDRPCTAEGCAHAARALGMCSTHYQRHRRARLGPCTVDGCDKDQSARGWCDGHYDRWRRHGDVLADTPLGTVVAVQPCGTFAAYHRGCRCFRCRQANAEVKRTQYRKRMVPAGRVIRHLERLLATGMSRAEIARRADLPSSTVATVLNSGRVHVHQHTADSILDVTARAEVGCVDCGGDPLPGGCLRCLRCFHVWKDTRAKVKAAQSRKAGLISTRLQERGAA